MRTKSPRSKRRPRYKLLLAAIAFIPLTGCAQLQGQLQGFVQGGGLAQIASALSGAAGSMSTGPGAAALPFMPSPSAGMTTGAPTTGGLGGANSGLTGGLPFADNPGTDGAGVLNLPLMAQSSGGQEAAIRGCGPTSLLMATNRPDPSEIQPVLVETCERPGGLVAGRAVNWLRSNGFPGSQHASNWTVEMLRDETMTRRNPVLVNYLSPRTGNGHIVVVVGVTEQGVHVNDPGPGAKRIIPVSEFERQWAGRNEWAIPVRA